jgi:hypothetical protein
MKVDNTLCRPPARHGDRFLTAVDPPLTSACLFAFRRSETQYRCSALVTQSILSLLQLGVRLKGPFFPIGRPLNRAKSRMSIRNWEIDDSLEEASFKGSRGGPEGGGLGGRVIGSQSPQNHRVYRLIVNLHLMGRALCRKVKLSIGFLSFLKIKPNPLLSLNEPINCEKGSDFFVPHSSESFSSNSSVSRETDPRVFSARQSQAPKKRSRGAYRWLSGQGAGGRERRTH